MTSLRSFVHNRMSLVGGLLSTVGAILFVVAFLLDLFGFYTNPYIGILFFFVFPAIFVLGLLFVPLGALVERRRRRAGQAPREVRWPRVTVDLNDARQRGVVIGVIILTMANIVIVSLASYRGVQYMDSVAFCGQVCHEVMQPEFTAYQDSPHSRVACVRCHIGPGAPWFVRSKLSGTRQVFAVLFNTHPRPLPSPIENLRPAREICEQCHWPEKFQGDKIKVVREYADDEQNSESVTTLRLHVGGGSERLGIATGIHWHMSVAHDVEYVALDEARQSIGYVRARDPDGTIREYFAPGVTSEQIAGRERRRLDCMDCHNRPAHPFALSAERAVDEAIASGQIPRTLAFVKREAVATLKGEYPPDHDSAAAAIAARMRRFYKDASSGQDPSRPQDVDRAIATVQRLYRRNVFPEMRVGWGTYPNNIGHTAFPGCFRCHDSEHAANDGRVIRQDCDLCHEIE